MVAQKDSIHPADSHWFQRLAPRSTWGFLEGRRQALGPCSPSCSLKPWWLTINVHGRNLWRDPRDCNLPKKPEVNVFLGMKWAAQCARRGGPRVLRREPSRARRRGAVPSCPVLSAPAARPTQWQSPECAERKLILACGGFYFSASQRISFCLNSPGFCFISLCF